MSRLFSVIIFSILFSGIHLFGQYRHTYLHLGEIELERKNYLEAINYFTHFIEDHDGMFEGYSARGLAKYNLDDLVGAESDFTKAIDRFPYYPRLFLLRGAVRADMYKLTLAIKDFNQSILLDSVYTLAYYNRSLANSRLMKIDLALSDCDRVIELDSNFRGIYNMRGSLYMEKENYKEAIVDFNKSLEQDNKRAGTYVERGKAYAKLEETDLALQDFDTALSIDSISSYAYFQRAVVFMDMMKHDEALDDLNKVLEISPNNELAYFNRGIIYYEKNMAEEAMEDWLSILDQNPDNVLVHYNMGVGYSKKGDKIEAINSFTRVLELFPDYAEAYLHRSKLRGELGDERGSYNDMLLYKALEEKNKLKDDTLKQEESVDLLKLAHLESDFFHQAKEENRIQFKKIDTKLRPPFQVKVDTLQIFSVNKEYELEGAFFMDNIELLDKEWFNSQMLALDSLLKKDPQNSGLYISRGMLYHLVNAYEQAIVDFNKALSFDPENHYIYLCRGNSFLAQLYNYTLGNKFGDSFTQYNKGLILRTYSDVTLNFQNAIKYKKDFLYARYNLGYAKFLIENYDEALKDFVFVSEKRKIPEASFNAGLLLIFQGLNDDACVELGLAGQLGLPEAYPVLRKYCK